MTKEEMITKVLEEQKIIRWHSFFKKAMSKAMDLFLDQETSALRAENERLRGLIKQMWYEEVGKYFDNISEKDHWYEQFETENNL